VIPDSNFKDTDKNVKMITGLRISSQNIFMKSTAPTSKYNDWIPIQ
jgi:hypothetical protein